MLDRWRIRVRQRSVRAVPPSAVCEVMKQRDVLLVCGAVVCELVSLRTQIRGRDLNDKIS